MIGRYLATLSPRQEQRLLTKSFGWSIDGRGHTCGCMVMVAEGVSSWCMTSGVRNDDRVVEIAGYMYERLTERYGVERANTMIRNRILKNQARRILTKTTEGVLV